MSSFIDGYRIWDQEPIRERLGAGAWQQFTRASRALAGRYDLPIEQAVALSAYTDRPIGALINATARAMADAAVVLPAEYETGAWLIRALDAGLAALPARPGVAWRGMMVHGPGGMPAELAARWEDAHQPERHVQYFGYCSHAAAPGAIYWGDWNIAARCLSARDISAANVHGEPEILVPRQAVFQNVGWRGDYWQQEEVRVNIPQIKPARQFAADAPAPPKWEPTEEAVRRFGERIREMALAGLDGRPLPRFDPSDYPLEDDEGGDQP